MARQWTSEDTEAMNVAADAAMEDFAKMFEAATTAQRRGMQLLRAWVKAWYMKAGYKRLMRGLFAFAALDALITTAEQEGGPK
jgi:uncharacterized protein YfaA (DUF2138 family)